MSSISAMKWSWPQWWRHLLGYLGNPDTRGFRILAALALALAAGKCVSLLRTNARRVQLKSRRKQFQMNCFLELRNLEETLANRKVTKESSEKITRLGTKDLARSLKSGDLYPTDVLLAYQCKALEVHSKTNCLIHPLAGAQELAGVRDEQETSNFPLYGIPVSLADDIAVKGYTAARGCAADLDNPCKEDSAVVQLLKKQGAIAFVKTNVPQLSFGLECGNPISGYTLNPKGTPLSLSAGGASGGEAALVAGGGSLIGIGSDCLGGLRLSAHFCGVTGFKPTFARLSSPATNDHGTTSGIVKQGLGFLAKDVDGVILLCRAVMSDAMFHIDRALAPLPFVDESLRSEDRLTIGCCLDDCVLTVSPACRRAVLQAKVVLEHMGHEVVSWRPPSADKALQLYLQCMLADGGALIRDTLRDDDIDPSLGQVLSLADQPGIARSIHVAASRLRDENLAYLLQNTTGARDERQYLLLAKEIENYRKCFMEHWQSSGLQAMLCPVHPVVACRPGNTSLLLCGLNYLALPSLLDMPAGVVPICHVTSDDLSEMRMSGVEEQIYQAMTQAMADSEGLPVAIQLVSEQWRDEVCLRLMRDLQAQIVNAGVTSP